MKPLRAALFVIIFQVVSAIVVVALGGGERSAPSAETAGEALSEEKHVAS